MINTSSQYKAQVTKNGRTFHGKAQITLADSTVLNVTDADIWNDGLAFEDSTSEQNSFQVGSAIAVELTLKLDNTDGRFDQYDFDGATVVPQIGLDLPGGTTEWVQKGYFKVYDPVANVSIITITALDNMAKFDRDYDSNVSFPNTLGVLLSDACDKCGVLLDTTTFTNSNYIVATKPTDGAKTFRDIVSYVAQLAGKWARINRLGKLVLDWYSYDGFYPDSGDIISGGNFKSKNLFNRDTVIKSYYVSYSNGQVYPNPLYSYSDWIPVLPSIVYTLSKNGPGDQLAFYGADKTYISGLVAPTTFTTPTNAYFVRVTTALTELDTQQLELGSAATAWEPNAYSGDILSGVTFTDYNQQDISCGGVFRQGLPSPTEIKSLKTCSCSTDDVKVTGVQIVPRDTDKTTYFKGTSGYVVSIEDNPLAQDNPDQLAANLATQLIGFTFRPMSVSALDDPSIEAGDVANFTDTKGNEHKTIISNISYKIGSFEKYSADAESQTERKSTRYSPSAKAIQSATERQISTYDVQVQQLSNLMANSFGLFTTDVKLSDNSVIHYMHDKPALADSKTVWKKTADAYAVSTDGGNTWNAGLTADGDAVVNILCAKKIASPDGKVYFDLMNSVIAANKMVSTTEGATDVYAEIGVVKWAGGAVSKGLGLYSEKGSFAYFDQSEDDALENPGLEVAVRGKIRLRSGASTTSDDNTFVMYSSADKTGNIEMWRARGTGNDTCVFQFNKDIGTITQDFSTDGSNYGGLYFRSDASLLGRYFSQTNKSELWLESEKIELAINGYTRAWADNNGFHASNGANGTIPAGATISVDHGIITGWY